MSKEIWKLTEGNSPVLATAVHDGHALREELQPFMALTDEERLREEDPLTGGWTSVAATRVIATQSRFEVDLNRPRERAVYRVPEDAWGLEVWKEPLPEALVQESLRGYDGFYAALERVYARKVAEHGAIVVLDLHSYNHRREGPVGDVADPAQNPQVNLGTGTLLERGPWEKLIARFVRDLSAQDFPGGALDVRENVKFRGGHCARWAHERFPGRVCVLSVEFKKFFMDEWSGRSDPALVDAIGSALRATVPGLLDELKERLSRR